MRCLGRGALIVVEGLDRAGKSTQSRLLSEHLEAQGIRVKRLRFPDRSTPIGESIDAYLKGQAHQDDHVIHLLFSANRWEAASQMRADIEAGFFIVVDRYYYSGIVYSAAKGNADLTLRWARDPEVGLPRPDICIFLDIEPEFAAQRGGFGGERYETTQMQRAVREGFHRLLKLPDGDNMVLVDAGRPLADVQQEVQKLVDAMLESDRIKLPLGQVPSW